MSRTERRSNQSVNPTVRPVTALAGARPAPRPSRRLRRPLGEWRPIVTRVFSMLLLVVTLIGCGSSEKSAVEQVATSQSPLDSILRSNYEAVVRMDRIPESVRAGLFHLMKYDPRLADKGERFNSTDLVDSRLPMRRLIFAGGTATAWFVYYEHGGRGYHRHLVIFALDGGLATCRYSCDVQEYVKNVSQLKTAASKGLVSCESCDGAYEF